MNIQCKVYTCTNSHNFQVDYYNHLCVSLWCFNNYECSIVRDCRSRQKIREIFAGVCEWKTREIFSCKPRVYWEKERERISLSSIKSKQRRVYSISTQKTIWVNTILSIDCQRKCNKRDKNFISVYGIAYKRRTNFTIFFCLHVRWEIEKKITCRWHQLKQSIAVLL